VFDSGDAVVRVAGAAGPAPVVTISGGAGGAGAGGRSRAQQLVTEMMILANEAAATLGARCRRPAGPESGWQTPGAMGWPCRPAPYMARGTSLNGCALLTLLTGVDACGLPV